jgi:hypothetical protein
MAAVRKVVELTITEAEQAELQSIARSRTEPASRVERARILLRYRPEHRKAAARADFTNAIADARAKVARAETVFIARLEAVDTILEDAEPYDVLMVCAHVLAQDIPLCCEAHEDEFKADLLRVLSDCTAQERDAVEAEAEGEGDDDAPPQVH